MRAPRYSFIALLVLALCFAAVQCVTACTASDCNSRVPPCHQHHNHDTRACSQDYQIPMAHPGIAPHAGAISVVAQTSLTLPQWLVVRQNRALASSPPAVERISPLRI